MKRTRLVNNWIEGWKEYMFNTEPPVLYHEWVAVSLLAAALSRKTFFTWQKKIYPNFYIVLVGPPGKCRKGTAMGPGRSMLDDLGVNIAAEATTREALIRALKKVNSSYVDNVTGISHGYSALNVYSEELTVFLGYNNIQLHSDLTDWFDCRDDWKYETKSQGVDKIKGVYVNLVGATTPALLISTLPKDAVGGGLTSRIIFVYEENKAKKVIFPKVTEKEENLRRELLADLREIALLQGEFRADKSWEDLWEVWYPKQDKHPMIDDPRMANYVDRRPLHVQKLSMVMHVSRNGDGVMTGEDLASAIELLERTEEKMKFTFSGFGDSDDAIILEKVMQTIGRVKRITYGELLKRHYYDTSHERLEGVILKTLQHIGFCTVKYAASVTESVIEYKPEEKK